MPHHILGYCHKKKNEKKNDMASFHEYFFTNDTSVSAKKEMKKIVVPTKKELATAIADYTALLSAMFCKERGYFTVVLSGGDLISWLRYV